jgi:hypothetical protein
MHVCKNREAACEGALKVKNAGIYKNRYHGCAPTAYALIADFAGMHFEDVFKALVGLSGGIGLVGNSSCGALIGAAAAIRLAFNLDREVLLANHDAEFKVHAAVSLVVDKFVTKYGGVTCNDVQTALHAKAFDLNTRKQREEFNLIEKRCPEAIKDAVDWAIASLLQCNLIRQRED